MDKHAGKYQKFYQREFDLAKSALENEGGIVEWSKNDYEAFTYRSDKVSLVFYPHKTSAMNHHVRVRNNGSRDQDEARRLLIMLNELENSCTFRCKKIPLSPTNPMNHRQG